MIVILFNCTSETDYSLQLCPYACSYKSESNISAQAHKVTPSVFRRASKRLRLLSSSSNLINVGIAARLSLKLIIFKYI